MTRALRPCECILISYFAYVALLAAAWRLPAGTQALACLIPLILLLLAFLESKQGTKATGVLREWIVPGLVLIAYQEIRWFQQPSNGYVFEHKWVAWDRIVLDDWHVRAAIESWGRSVPFVLDFSYLLVYAIPPFALAVLYRNHLRNRIDIFLFTFLLGTLFAYAVLPYFPSAPPRWLFAGQDLPQVTTALRRLNIWLLDRYDIRTSVFPSGHVTAAFSSAFGMLLAFPEKKRVGALLMVLATAIAITTVYGRYHYLVDGVAGLLISIAAGCISAAVFSPARRRAPSGTRSVSAAHAGS